MNLIYLCILAIPLIVYYILGFSKMDSNLTPIIILFLTGLLAAVVITYLLYSKGLLDINTIKHYLEEKGVRV